MSDNDPTALEGGKTPQGGGDVTVSDATNMVRCGVNMIGLDNLMPFDARLAALVWSWAPNEPRMNVPGACAVEGPDGRFSSTPCATRSALPQARGGRYRFACFDGTVWHVTRRADRFSSGATECAREGFGTFAVPRGGYDNEFLRAAHAAVPYVWVNSLYVAGSGWVPGS